MTDYPEAQATRPLWLVTLADLALLLLGFVVLVQATGGIDRAKLAGGFREGFGAEPEAPIAVAAYAVQGFAPGSAVATQDAGLIDWAREAVRDPRVRLTIAGATDGTAADVDHETRSAAILASDRARAVAALLARVVPADRVTITTATRNTRRMASVTQGFAGEGR